MDINNTDDINDLNNSSDTNDINDLNNSSDTNDINDLNNSSDTNDDSAPLHDPIKSEELIIKNFILRN